MSVFKEIDLCETKDWGPEQFLDLTEGGHHSLVVRHAFDPARATDEAIAPLNSKIKYTTKPRNFKMGDNYRSVRLRQYLSLIHGNEDFYSSWGTSSMNDQGDAMDAFKLGAQFFVDECLNESWSGIVPSKEEESELEIKGHFIAGNTPRYGVKTENHYVLSLNHVFQIFGEKTWYLSDPTEAMKMPQFFQFNPMEFMIAIKPKEYAELPFVEKMVTRPGDYFYNAPLVGHAVAMGPGKNVMLSIRQPTRDFVVRPELLPLLHRAVNVTRAVIHSDVRRFHRWSKLTMDHDNSLYGNRKPVSQSGLLPRASRVGKRILSAVAGRLRGR